MDDIIMSQTYAIKYAKELTKETGKRHIVRPIAIGNKVGYQVINTQRYQKG